MLLRPSNTYPICKWSFDTNIISMTSRREFPCRIELPDKPKILNIKKDLSRVHDIMIRIIHCHNMPTTNLIQVVFPLKLNGKVLAKATEVTPGRRLTSPTTFRPSATACSSFPYVERGAATIMVIRCFVSKPVSTCSKR